MDCHETEATSSGEHRTWAVETLTLVSACSAAPPVVRGLKPPAPPEPVKKAARKAALLLEIPVLVNATDLEPGTPMSAPPVEG
eukprot:12225323-Alexandrium_andersonii.AAC.1